jgi:hypothetical protein
MSRPIVLLEDVQGRRPEADEPFVDLFRSHGLQDYPIPGVYENLLIRSFLVPTEYRDRCVGSIQISDFDWWPERGFIDEAGNYDPDEVREFEGIPMEIVVRSRSFEGVDLGYWEPMDRVVAELQLHSTPREADQQRRWVDPRTAPETVVIRASPTLPGCEDQFVEIRLAELRRYLSVRGQGLFVMRFVERLCEFPEPVPDLPPDGQFDVENGRKTWHPGWRDREAEEMFTYLCRLWESFWIDPPERTRISRPGNEFHDGVEFRLGNGDSSTFGDDERRYFEPLSFPPSIIRQFESWGANHRVEWTSLTKCQLRAPSVFLSGGMNDSGQFQTLFGQMAKHRVEVQRRFAPHSEPMSAPLNSECVEAWELGRFPSSRALQWTVANALGEVSRPWIDRYGQSLLRETSEEEIPDPVGPTGNSFGELADLGLDWRRALLSEVNPQRIKEDLLSTDATEADFDSWGSIKVTRRLFELLLRSEDDAMVLGTINKLRTLRGHPAGDVESALQDVGLPARSTRHTYVVLLEQICRFLIRFREVSESALGVAIAAQDRRSFVDPWWQLKHAEAYFRRLAEL